MVLFIVAVLMVDLSLTAETARRSARNASGEFFMDAAVDAQLQVILAQLRYDLALNKVDSLDDRWALEAFNSIKVDREVDPDDPRDEDREDDDEDLGPGGIDVLGSTEDVEIEARVEDEERKFNLNMLMDDDKTRREAARERFALLIDRYREDTPLDVSSTVAAALRDAVIAYLERRSPAEGSIGEMPVPKTGKWRMLTPDELVNVKDFEDQSRGWSAQFLLYDAREPEEAARYAEDPESEKPEEFPGLIRYLTLWSGTAWIDAPDGASWVRININTAEKPVLETLFYKNPDDLGLVDAILEYRNQEKTEDGGSTSMLEDEQREQHQVFETVDDLKKVEGIDDQILQRNGISATTVTVQSNTFSIDFLASLERSQGNPVRRQTRYIVRRHDKGIQTLLRERRRDPRYEDENDPEEEEEDEMDEDASTRQ
jgi:hypothetical protein